MAKGDFRKRTRLSQLAVEEKNRLKRGPSKYITKGRGKRVLNPKWTAWNKKKTDASDLKIRQKENEEEQRKYIREEKPDGTVTVRKRTAVDSMDDIKKYSDSAYRKNQKETEKDPYTKKPEVTSENAADNAAKTKLNIGRNQQKTDVNEKTKTPKDTGGTSAADRKGWLEKTKNSPAGKAFGDSKEWNTKRWNLQKNKRLKDAAKQAAKLKKLAEAERLRKLALQQQKLQINK